MGPAEQCKDLWGWLLPKVSNHPFISLAVALLGAAFILGIALTLLYRVLLRHVDKQADRTGEEVSLLWYKRGGRAGKSSGHAAAPAEAADLFARGVLAVVGAAYDLATAPTNDPELESYLLYALVHATKSEAVMARRASIMKVSTSSRGPAMSVHRGEPPVLFHKPYTSFAEKDYDTHGTGLCWRAVHACAGGHAQDSIERRVFHVKNVGDHPGWTTTVVGHHPFKSIMIAPIVGRGGVVLGAVCLDSDQSDHYSNKDEILVALSAMALGILWNGRASPPTEPKQNPPPP